MDSSSKTLTSGRKRNFRLLPLFKSLFYPLLYTPSGYLISSSSSGSDWSTGRLVTRDIRRGKHLPQYATLSNGGYTLCFWSLAAGADTTLSTSVIRDENHIIRGLCFNSPTVAYNLRPYQQFFPPKGDNSNFLSLMLFQDVYWHSPTSSWSYNL